MNFKTFIPEGSTYLPPDECRALGLKIRADKTHAFWGDLYGQKHGSDASNRAVEYVRLLDEGHITGKGFILDNWIEKYDAELEGVLKEQYGASLHGEGRSSSFGTWPASEDKILPGEFR